MMARANDVIRQDDPQAVEKARKKLADREEKHKTMKAVNAWYRKNGTLDGCPVLTPELRKSAKDNMRYGCFNGKPTPFPSYVLTNNNAEIRRLKARIEELERISNAAWEGWEFDGGYVDANVDDSRLQVFFDEKPDEGVREALKAHGFKWAPSVGAWQRLLNSSAYFAASHIEGLRPLDGRTIPEHFSTVA